MKVFLKACHSIAMAVLIISVLLSLSCNVFGDNDYTDIDENEWYSDYIRVIVEREIMDGESATIFSPNTPAKRSVIVEALYRIENKPAVVNKSLFDDVNYSDNFYQAVQWASDNAIVNGYGDGKFGPNDEVTREQFVTIVYRYCKYKNISVNKTDDLKHFNDSKKISSFAEIPIKWAVANNIIEGEPGGILNPKGNVLRCQTAAILCRLINEYRLIDNLEDIEEIAIDKQQTSILNSDEPTFIVSSSTAKSGETATVTIALKNNPGIASIGLSVAYPRTQNESIGTMKKPGKLMTQTLRFMSRSTDLEIKCLTITKLIT
ncbi:MAG: S-layer homology domain-containing protein [Oscillospiraceae bacterium]|nr:S-layer homology domain-containing protein [Oscillospiraceae bacterium]